MAVPTTREQFKEYCLRRLGAPVIDINVDDEQVEDRIDEALIYYADYHFDGTERVFYKHVVNAEDKANRYLTLPQSIIGVSNMLPYSNLQTNNMFNIRYQFALNDLYQLSAGSFLSYHMAMTYLAEIQQLFVGQKPMRYNRHVNKLHIDMDWGSITEGEFLIIDCYMVTDPVTYTDVWGDRWLATYATALIKRQWGNNLKKFDGMQMPGGMTFNGQKIYDEAEEEILKMEKEMITSYSLPAYDLIG